MMKIWKAIGKFKIPNNLIIGTKNVYTDNSVSVKIKQKVDKSFKTSKGCATSPTLFKIFLEMTLVPWKKKCECMGIPDRNKHLHILSFPDVQVVMA